jgi:hypothetical protein
LRADLRGTDFREAFVRDVFAGIAFFLLRERKYNARDWCAVRAAGEFHSIVFLRAGA